MKKLKYCLILGSLIIFAIIFPSRYLGSTSGVSTTGGDYSVHLNINAHIDNLDLFPSLSDKTESLHSVSKYLPIYHGLLGFHITAKFLEFMGIPLPGAYGLIMDLSLLTILLIFLFIAIDNINRKDILIPFALSILTVLLFIKYFLTAVDAAYYSQLFSHALISLAVYLFTLQKRRSALVLISFAIFCYPDFLLWFIPVALFSKRCRSFRPILFGILLILAVVPFKRANLSGPTLTSASVYFTTLAFIIFFISGIWNWNRNAAILAGAFAVYSLSLYLGTMKFSNPSYYAVKLTGFSYLLLPYLLLTVPIRLTFLRKLVLAAIAFALVYEVSSSHYDIQPFVSNSGNFQNLDYLRAKNASIEIQKNLAGKCIDRTTYKIPAQDKNSFLSLAAFNGVLTSFDIYSLNLKSSWLNNFYNGGINGSQGMLIQDLLNENLSVWVKKLETEIQRTNLDPDFCLASPKNQASFFAKSQYFEKLYEGAQFVYFKPQKR
ncbi:hypothetical protein [Bdellovibrio sp. ZAP7]|uniref:hypothetical protein n=1 Tax=Bdellovibrio sp. ZAP7 TaxID=2231053 RepID=UPI00143D7CAE|nr:hypothetical protein [Bdellovibrio sp. ZAP7]